MKTIEASKLPKEIKRSLEIQNSGKWFAGNQATWLPKGDNPNSESNKAVVVHQTESGEYVALKRYEF